MLTIDKITFTSPINIDNGYTNIPQGEYESEMELYHSNPDQLMIEWSIPSLDEVLHIYLDLEEDEKIVVDFEGVYELPEQAIQLLIKNGFNCEQVK